MAYGMARIESGILCDSTQTVTGYLNEDTEQGDMSASCHDEMFVFKYL